MNAASIAPAKLAMHRYPATMPGGERETFVLLHGWGCDSQTWKPLLPYLRQLGNVVAIDLPGFGKSPGLPAFNLDLVLDVLERNLISGSTLLGWSFGGMLAVALAALAPEKVVRVITLASNLKFVAAADYPDAMPFAVNQQFNLGFVADQQATLKLFGALVAQGDANERGLLKAMRANRVDMCPTDNWCQALELLATLDNRHAFSRLTQPGLHIFAESDALVPATAADHLRRLNETQRVVVVPQTAHALHWSRPEKIAQLIVELLRPATLDKRKVATSFSRAATSYDSVAQLQREVGRCLLEKTSAVDPGKRILDLGCGTGFFCDQLLQKFSQADVIGLDIAEGMLHFARSHRQQSVKWVCGDAECLPLQSGSVDLIFSSLAIQWCDDLPQLFAEARRVLKPGGCFLFSTLGPNTLHELKAAWLAVDGYVHVNRFQAAVEVQAQLKVADFSVEHWHREYRILGFNRLVDLTRELKALGAHNMNPGQPGGLTGRRKLEALKSAYENYRLDNLLPATYEVFYAAVRAS